MNKLIGGGGRGRDAGAEGTGYRLGNSKPRPRAWLFQGNSSTACLPTTTPAAIRGRVLKIARSGGRWCRKCSTSPPAANTDDAHKPQYGSRENAPMAERVSRITRVREAARKNRAGRSFEMSKPRVYHAAPAMKFTG